jgi:hypothetical protein
MMHPEGIEIADEFVGAAIRLHTKESNDGLGQNRLGFW